MAVLIVLLSVINNAFDLVGISLIYFYISSVINPEQILKIELLTDLRHLLGLNSDRAFFIFLGFVLLFFYLVRSLITIIFQLCLPKFSYSWFCSISELLLKSYLSFKYSYYLKNHTSEAKHAVVDGTFRLTHSFVLPILVLASEAFSVLVILVLLFIIKPQLSPILLAVCGITFVLYLLSSKKIIKHIGHSRIKAGRSRHKIINEMFNVIKEILIFPQAAQFFINQYKEANEEYSQSAVHNHLIGVIPRNILEFLSIVAILTIVVYELFTALNINESLAVIALYGVAAMRLLPSCTKIIFSISVIKTEAPSFKEVYQIIELYRKSSRQTLAESAMLHFKKSISLRGVFYQYYGTSSNALKNVSLTIPKHSFVGVFGESGSGKSTLLDVIMGLIKPQKGAIYIDGKKVTGERNDACKISVGYVPQRFTLIDASIAENIAFGIDKKDINFKQLRKVCRLAGISQFIETQLPQGYQTRVGERGSRFSGGQAQRLAIARALYHNPEILILDEATSSLDERSEKEVLNTIENLRKNVTIILVTHKPSALKTVDMVYVFHDGRITDRGTYNKTIKK
jgi:ABC-type multidrug transport system fused ATPase/permease subunit